jgi:hypothetical protein
LIFLIPEEAKARREKRLAEILAFEEQLLREAEEERAREQESAPDHAENKGRGRK